MEESGTAWPWYALAVRPRHEKRISVHLRVRGYEEYLPLFTSRRRWTDRIKEIEIPLFPGYLFCRFDPSRRLPILTIPGVLCIISAGRMPLAVDEEELKAVQDVVRSGLPLERWQYLQAGQEIRIVDGPLQGVTGFLLQIRNHSRLVVSISLLQRSVAVEVESTWVEAASPRDILATRAIAASQP